MKKILSIILTATIVMNILPMGIFAADETTKEPINEVVLEDQAGEIEAEVSVEQTPEVPSENQDSVLESVPPQEGEESTPPQENTEGEPAQGNEGAQGNDLVADEVETETEAVPLQQNALPTENTQSVENRAAVETGQLRYVHMIPNADGYTVVDDVQDLGGKVYYDSVGNKKFMDYMVIMNNKAIEFSAQGYEISHAAIKQNMNIVFDGSKQDAEIVNNLAFSAYNIIYIYYKKTPVVEETGSLKYVHMVPSADGYTATDDEQVYQDTVGNKKFMDYIAIMNDKADKFLEEKLSAEYKISHAVIKQNGTVVFEGSKYNPAIVNNLAFAKDNVIYIYYQKTVQFTDVAVKFVNADGEEIAPSQVFADKEIGKVFEITKQDMPTVAGYTPKLESYSTVLADTTTEIEIVYNAHITVKHIYNSNRQYAAADVVSAQSKPLEKDASIADLIKKEYYNTNVHYVHKATQAYINGSEQATGLQHQVMGAQPIVVELIYDVDMIRDVNANVPNTIPGDMIPDNCQIILTFRSAGNGIIKLDGSATDTITEVITKRNQATNMVDPNGIAYPAAKDIVNNAAAGYNFANWSTMANGTFTSVESLRQAPIVSDTLFTANFAVMPAAPAPETPAGPTPPTAPVVDTPVVPAPVVPVVPGPVVIPDDDVPQGPTADEDIDADIDADTEQDTTPVVIPDDFVPQGPAPVSSSWALVNLLLAIATAVISLILLIGYYFGKNKNENDEDTLKRKGFARIMSLIPAIVGVIAFILTENMSNPMVMVDKWTLLMAVIAVAQIVVCLFCKKTDEQSNRENA